MPNYPLPPRLNHSTAFLMVRVMKEGYRWANKLFEGEKLRLMHYAAAAYIAEYEDISQKALSQLLLIDPSDIGSIVQDLETAGYITRQPDTQDRRRLTLTITADGSDWLVERETNARKFENDFLQTLSLKDRKKLHKLLKGVMHN